MGGAHPNIIGPTQLPREFPQNDGNFWIEGVEPQQNARQKNQV